MSDTSAFIDLLHVSPEAKSLFSPGEVIITRAPGRLDVMGGIADYSGSLVLPFPIAAATHVAIQLHDELVVRIRSLSEGSLRKFEMQLNVLDEPVAYETAHAMFRADTWAAYVAGAFLVLMREKQVVFDRGANIFISSEVPEGKGVSSSAALEVASMMAIVCS